MRFHSTIHYRFRFFLLAGLLVMGTCLWAQQHATKKAATTADKKEKKVTLLLPYTYLGDGYRGGEIHAHDLDAVLKNGFKAKDSSGNSYKIVGFNFTYAERNLYEDSVGNLQVLTDIMSNYCDGDTLSADIAASIYQRIKAGDTIFIDRVTVQPLAGNTVLSPTDTSAMAGKGMKCVVVK